MAYFWSNLKEYARVATPLFLGVAIGFFVATHAQRKINQEQQRECRASDHRRLVSLETAVGRADYCIPLHYLAK
jgi:hypothetical protein